MMVHRTVILTFLLSGLLWAADTPSTVSCKVKVWSSKGGTEHRLTAKNADLVIDPTSRKLFVRGAARPIELGFDQVRGVVIDPTRHMRGGKLGRALGNGLGGITGALAQSAIENKSVNDHWVLLEFTNPSGQEAGCALEVRQESAQRVIATITQEFGDRVTVAAFPEKPAIYDRNKLKEFDIKHELTVDKKSHPIPAAIPDKALVVMVCPALEGFARGNPSAARFLVSNDVMVGQFKVYANGRVFGINRPGTYCFAYLDPGDYDLVSLVSRGKTAFGFRVSLAAGQEYFFLQNPFKGGQEVLLSRHTRELALFLLEGSEYCQWREKTHHK